VERPADDRRPGNAKPRQLGLNRQGGAAGAAGVVGLLAGRDVFRETPIAALRDV